MELLRGEPLKFHQSKPHVSLHSRYSTQRRKCGLSVKRKCLLGSPVQLLIFRQHAQCGKRMTDSAPRRTEVAAATVIQPRLRRDGGSSVLGGMQMKS